MSGAKKSFVQDNFLLTNSTPIPVGSPLWYAWLDTAKKFTFKSQSGGFTAQCETRRNKPYWYAYRRRAGKLIKVYLGKTQELTGGRLEQASLLLAGQTPLAQFTHPPLGNENFSLESRIDTSFLPMTKINVPMLPRQLVSRPRLNQQINTPLTLIYAPSGFGKSTLLNDWKQACGYPVAWLSLDEQDNHPARFWSSVMTAFQTLQPDFGKELRSYLGSTVSIHPPEAVLRLTNDILQSQADFPRLGLVLDDFDHLHNSSLYDSLQAWIEHFPANMQLVISGHTKPPLSLGHLRAQGLLTELEANDLRFTIEEGVHYLRQYPQETPFAYADLEKLVKHTEGWAAGLTLTALALSKQGDRRQFIDTFSGAHIYLREYFMETVLQRSTPEMQAFLLKTAILKHLTGSLCDALTGQTNGEEMLALLWQENLFIVRLEEHGWYRYHDLFAEMLLSQLQVRFPAEIPQLHQRAAQWYREQYAPADAIYHLLSTKAWEEAATLIEEMALRELEQYGEDSRLLRWLQELPESVVQKHKTLLFVYLRLAALALARKQTESFILRIETNLDRKPLTQQTPDEQEVLSEIRQIRGAWARGEKLTLPPTAENEADPRWELLDRLCLVMPISAPTVEQTDEQLAQLCEMAHAQQNLFVILMAGGVRARRTILLGQLKRSEKIAQQVLQQALAQRGKLPEPASIALAALSQIAYERNNLEAAKKYVQRVMEVDPNPTSTNMSVLVAIQRAKIQMAEKKGDEARATLQAIQELHAQRPSNSWKDQDLLVYEALACLRNQDLLAAEHLMNQAGEPGVEALYDLVYAEMSLERKQFKLAETLLIRLMNTYPHGMQDEPLMGARVLLALALFGQHKINQARQVMTEAIRLAAPEKFIRPFLESGGACAPLVSLVLQTENLTSEAQAFLQEILQHLGQAGEKIQISATHMEALTVSASISPREQEVLRLMKTGASNREIAAQLCLSESTVKTHLGHIYEKLGVNSRVVAITRARELNLV